jgi:predicted RNase H-like nuclease (RuvC/YqgF family)
MSVIDLLTDENYRAIIKSTEETIRDLMGTIKYFREERDRLQKLNEFKTKRIVSLTEELNFLNRELGAAK